MKDDIFIGSALGIMGILIVIAFCLSETTLIAKVLMSLPGAVLIVGAIWFFVDALRHKDVVTQKVE